jgi:A/G-specific adenine glycosylase
MLLRQTQAIAVAKMWRPFIQRYPDAKTLTQADQNELFTQLKVLGLASQRSSALLEAASWLVEHHKGQVPATLEELVKIPHVGLYVAHAVVCFAFGQPVEVVDTNVLRFFARYHEIHVPPDIRRAPTIWKVARQALPKRREDVQPHNYGFLDFTAQICRSRSPQCNICPLLSGCKWGSHQLAIVEGKVKQGTPNQYRIML